MSSNQSPPPNQYPPPPRRMFRQINGYPYYSILKENVDNLPDGLNDTYSLAATLDLHMRNNNIDRSNFKIDFNDLLDIYNNELPQQHGGSKKAVKKSS